MVSDGERREVVRKTRERAQRLREDCGFDCIDEIPDWLRGLTRFSCGSCDRPWACFEVLADLIEPSCDRDALLALVDEIEQDADGCTAIAVGALYDYVDRIRKALGVSE